ncbi:DNA-dependent protein kinase catalytic subunit-like isoform X2 [Bolinopsis microptera]|uniref:DNA-dependent protein kinase catalytic subunit-like isoform X2 n=1 Tax=Bolinopsis microptera TaxID=2820187 RepID=UPI003079C322
MAANVKVLLDNLHECLNIGAVEALPVVLDLQSSVGGCSDHELVIGIAHLLDPTKGVLIFLERSCHFPGKEWPKVCAELLALLKELVKNKLSLDKHIFVIIDGCMSLFTKIETKANIVLVTNLIQDCLKKLHEQGGGSEKTMDISDLIYKSLSNKTRSSITVIDAICGLVQTLLETSPSMFDNERVTKWLGFFMHSLKTEMITKGQKKKPPDLQLISGSFNGINGVLSAFSDVVSQTTVGEIFRLLVLCCNPNVEAKRHAMQTSVLTLLAEHTPKFKEFLYKDNIKLLDFLVKMLSTVKNAGLRSSICKALSALVLEMSKEMMVNEEEGPTLFHHYLSVLVPLLTSLHRRQISAVMQCLGHLAHPCKVILGEEKLLQLFKKILVAGESVCVGSGSEADYSSLLPSVISALADTVNCIQTISPDIRHHLAAPLVSLVEVFPELHVKLQGGCYHSIQALLAAVHSDRDAFLWLLNELTYQGLLRCSSNSEPAEYSSLWSDLLTKYTYLITDTDVKRDLHISLLDALINSFLVIFEKLDLKVAEQDTMEDTDEDRMIVDNPPNKDLELLGNLSSLLTDVISTVDDDRLEKWVLLLVKSTVEASDKVPDAQCCYWLLKSVVCYCDTSHYFSSPYHLAEVGSILRQFGYTVIERLDRLVEDTRIASISLLLSYPVTLIQGSVEMFTLAIKEALSRGIGCLELGRRGVESVWRVVRAGESNILSDHYPDILPLINPYLTSKANTTDKSEISLYELQCDMVLLLGTLGGQVNSHLITLQLPDISWSNETVLTVALPLGPSLLNICLDEMLREVITLCKTTSEGQARTCACELLHALFLVSISTEQQAPDKIKVLYDHTLPVLLELGCDSNSVVRQIFKELTFQIIHWQTSRSKDSFILHHIMSGIQQSGNIELREFCGECIGEFFKWSMKHSSDVMSPAVRNVFKQLIYCAEHPASTKQLAAATAFNAFYRTFREEEVLVSDYTMILISLLLDSYNIKYSSSLQLSLTHLTRIVTSKHQLFIKSTKTRFVPRFGEEGTLFELTKHSFSLTFSPKAHVREIARTMYLKIYHLIPGWCVTVTGPHDC